MLLWVHAALFSSWVSFFILLFFFNDTATTEIYTLSLHDALPISTETFGHLVQIGAAKVNDLDHFDLTLQEFGLPGVARDAVQHQHFRLRVELVDHRQPDRKSTRLNSSHPSISYAVFCLKKKKIKI